MKLAALETERAVVVGNKVRQALAAVRPVPLTAGTVTHGEAVVAATEEVSIFAALRPMSVGIATTKVVLGFDRMLVTGVEWGLYDAVLPQGDAQRMRAGQLRQIHTYLFTEGTDFTQGSMNTRWGGFVGLRNRMQEPAIAAAIDAVGMRPFADHVFGHIELFGRILGEDGGKSTAGEARANAAWLEELGLFMAQVMLDYRGDTAMQNELLGAYYAQLEDQRAVNRATRRRLRAAKKQADANTSSGDQANAQSPPAAPANGSASAGAPANGSAPAAEPAPPPAPPAQPMPAADSSAPAPAVG